MNKSKNIILTLAAVLSTLLGSVDALRADDHSIIPGKSIGQTQLGPNGQDYLNKLPKPTSDDYSMGRASMIWVTKKDGREDRLFIYSVSNEPRDIKPLKGRTIREIRITSPFFHTREGIATGSTYAEILKAFPDAKLAGSIAQDSKKGIGFEFSEKPTEKSKCIAISVLDKDADMSSADKVKDFGH